MSPIQPMQVAVIAAGIIGLVLVLWWRRRAKAALDRLSADGRELHRRLRQRWFVFGVVLFFVAGSVCVNVLSAPGNGWAQMIAAIPPIAAWAVIESIHFPHRNKGTLAGRVAGTLVVGIGAVWLSFLHQREVLIQIGYDSRSASVFPILLDGLMITYTLVLVDVVRDLRELRVRVEGAAITQHATAEKVAQLAVSTPRPVYSVGQDARRGPRGDYGPTKGTEYEPRYARKRAAAGKSPVPAKAPGRRRSSAASRPTEKTSPAMAANAAPVMSDDEYGPWLPDGDERIPVSPGMGPVQ